ALRPRAAAKDRGGRSLTRRTLLRLDTDRLSPALADSKSDREQNRGAHSAAGGSGPYMGYSVHFERSFAMASRRLSGVRLRGGGDRRPHRRISSLARGGL